MGMEPQKLNTVTQLSEAPPSKQLEISNAVVRIYKHYTGRGPQSARTHLSDELAVVMLTGVLTRAERSLYEAGNHDLLTTQHAAMQRLMSDEMVAAVGAIVGRDVISFMSTSDPEKEIGVEVFVLESARHSTAAQAAPRRQETSALPGDAAAG